MALGGLEWYVTSTVGVVACGRCEHWADWPSQSPKQGMTDMAIPRDKDARRFYRVAQLRLEDGGLILDKLGRPAAAVYLTGYAVECVLKALLIASTPVNQRATVLAWFRGKLAHDIFWLQERLFQCGVRPPQEIVKELTHASGWSTDLRYEPGPGDPEDAERMLKSAELIFRWASERMT